MWEHMIFEQLEDVISHIQVIVNGQQPVPIVNWRVVRVDVLDAALDLERRHLITLQQPTKTKQVDGRRITSKWKRTQTNI